MAVRSRRPRDPGPGHRAARARRHGRRDPGPHPPPHLVCLGPGRKVKSLTKLTFSYLILIKVLGEGQKVSRGFPTV